MDIHNGYPLCKDRKENVDHLFVTCPLSKRLWEFFLPSFKRGWAIPTCAKDALGEDLITDPVYSKAKCIDGQLAYYPRLSCGFYGIKAGGSSKTKLRNCIIYKWVYKRSCINGQEERHCLGGLISTTSLWNGRGWWRERPYFCFCIRTWCC